MSEWEDDADSAVIVAETVKGGELIPMPRDTGRLLRGDAAEVRETMAELKAIRTFIASEMVDGLDFGIIPGTGNKKNMLLPGAQKVCMFFNVYPEYDVQATDLGGGHVEYVVKTALISRATRQRVASGVGSCATMEGKYRYRSAERKCPQCGAAAIIRGKKEYGGGYVCFDKKGGCKAKFRDGDPAIESQDAGKVENPDIYDTRNTVLKMAKKRSLVDASIGVGCLSELFTQDLEDIFDIQVTGTGEAASALPPTRQAEASSASTAPSAKAEPSPRKASSSPAPGNSNSDSIIVGVISCDEPKANDFAIDKWQMRAKCTDGVWRPFQGYQVVELAQKACSSGGKLRVTVKLNRSRDGKVFENVIAAEAVE
jgi:predicted RNA-binding Zn-ribbon protein involved in translation (DUF1610 family)